MKTVPAQNRKGMASAQSGASGYVDLASCEPDGQEAFERFAEALERHDVHSCLTMIHGDTRSAIEVGVPCL